MYLTELDRFEIDSASIEWSTCFRSLETAFFHKRPFFRHSIFHTLILTAFDGCDIKLASDEIFSNLQPRQAWNLFLGCSRSSDSLSPTNRFLGCGLLEVLFFYLYV